METSSPLLNSNLPPPPSDVCSNADTSTHERGTLARFARHDTSAEAYARARVRSGRAEQQSACLSAFASSGRKHQKYETLCFDNRNMAGGETTA